jgi:hypothetical protein
LKEREKNDMAVNKQVTQKTITASDAAVLRSAAKMSKKYRKTLDRLAKN